MIPDQPGLSEQTGYRQPASLVQRFWSLCDDKLGGYCDEMAYRCTALNRALEGSEQSQHLSGEAADIYVSGRQMCQKYVNILQHTDFDQMILEPLDSHLKRWIHISHRRNGENRHQIIGDI